MENGIDLIGGKFLNWWSDIHDIEHDGKNANRGDLAKLRCLDLINGEEGRVIDVISARSIYSYRLLYHSVVPLFLKLKPWIKSFEIEFEERLIIASYALAWIRESERKGVSLGSKLGSNIDGMPPRNDEIPIFREERFIRLIRAKTNADLFDETRRMCRLMGLSAPIEDLAKTIFEWNEDHTRRRLSENYYHLNSPTFEA